MAAATIDEYLAGVPADKRAALQKLREQIQAAEPEATEVISYGLPTFKLDGRWLVAFGAAKGYCSFYVGGGRAFEVHADELASYRLWKGTINFKTDQPLPEELVTSMVQIRAAERRAG